MRGGGDWKQKFLLFLCPYSDAIRVIPDLLHQILKLLELALELLELVLELMELVLKFGLDLHD